MKETEASYNEPNEPHDEWGRPLTLSNMKDKMIYNFIGGKTMEFIYDKENSYFNNFYNWYAINTDERRSYNQRPYTIEEAIDEFNKLYGHFNKRIFGLL